LCDLRKFDRGCGAAAGWAVDLCGFVGIRILDQRENGFCAADFRLGEGRGSERFDAERARASRRHNEPRLCWSA
jgi:hypothetical protein